MEIVGNVWEQSGQKLLTLFKGVVESIGSIFKNLYYTILKPIWDIIIGSLDKLWENHLKGLVESVLGFFASLGEAVMTVWNNFLAPLVNWLIDTFGPFFVKVFGSVWDTICMVFGGLSDALSGIFDALGGLLDFISGVFSGDWEKAWNGIKKFFKGVWDFIWGCVKTVVNLIIKGINMLWSGLYKVLAGIINGIGDVIGWVGDLFGCDWGWEIPSQAPQIPYLARGGIIDQPTLAMVGEKGKEAVVPLENTAFADSIANAILRVLTPLFREGGASGRNVDNNRVLVLKVGEYELGRVSVGAINKYHNVVGKVELEV